MAEIFVTQDGSHSIFSDKFGVPYHSKYGAIQETQHVFIEAALYPKALIKKDINILEIGFGTGLNAFMTYLEAEKRELKVEFTTFEKYPITQAKAAELNFPQQLSALNFASVFQKLHDAPWNEPLELSPRFLFEKQHKDFIEITAQNHFDLIYFDAFAPNAQPELWEQPLMQKMFDALKEGGILTTYCAKGAVKRMLKSVGFEIESLQGPPGKREMTRAHKRLNN